VQSKKGIQLDALSLCRSIVCLEAETYLSVDTPVVSSVTTAKTTETSAGGGGRSKQGRAQITYWII
jgi:hypothetical protein